MRKIRFIMNLMAFLGVVGWILLVVPDLHFLYKYLMPILGNAKYLAFLVMGIAMFLCLPIALTRKVFNRLIPSKCQSLTEKFAMGFVCIGSVFVSRSFM